MTDTVTKSVPSNNPIAGYHYTYNSLNQRERVEQGDATYWDYNYDALGQVIGGKKKLPGGQQLNGYDFGYSFDGIGNRVTASANGNTQTYTANGLNQYTQRTVPGAVDVVGEADPAASVKVNSQPATRQGDYFHKQVSVGNASAPQYPLITVTAEKGTSITTKSGNVYVPKTPEQYTYDLDGNMLSDGRWNYTWDCENRLVGMESLSTVPAEARQKITYHYDYMSRRIAKRVDTWNVTTSSWNTGELHTFYYDGWNLYAEVTPNAAEDAIKGEYVWGVDLSGSLQGAGGVGGLLSVQTESGGGSVISDGNGNVMKIVNSLGTKADYEYGPFGELIRMTGPAAKANPFRFSTKYQETESGLLYYGYRFYNPMTGRWINRDPIEEVGGVNLYVAIGNNLIDAVDLLGREQLTVTQKMNAILRIMKNKGWNKAYKALSLWKSRFQGDKTPAEIDVNWVLGFSQVNEPYKKLMDTADSENSKNLIRKILRREKICGDFDFTKYTGRYADDHENRVNGRNPDKIFYNQSSAKDEYSNTPDDLEATLGRFQLRLTVKGFIKKGVVTITGGGVYVQDEYHFRDDSWVSQPLGYWGEPNYVGVDAKEGAFPVTNKLFQDWQVDNMPHGGDYFIYSRQKPVKLNFEFFY